MAMATAAAALFSTAPITAVQAGDEKLAFDKLREGSDFHDICETLTSIVRESEIPLRIATLLKGWISQELITGIQSNNQQK